MGKKFKFDIYRKNRPVDIIIMIYLIYIVGFYPLFMTNLYFNITVTRARTFIYGTVAFIFLAVCAWIIELILISYYTDKDIFGIYKDSKIYAMPEFWMALFLVANIFAWIMAEDKHNALTGEDARYFGLGMIMVIAFMFVIISRQAYAGKIIYMIFLVVSCFSYVLGILQHVGFDPFKLRENVAAKQKEMFISTFGNINIFGSYICLSMAIMLGVYIFSTSKLVRGISVIGIFAGAMSIITAKSDNVYIGIFAAGIILFYMAVSAKKTEKWMSSLFIVFCGLFVMSIINEKYHTKDRHLNGIAEIIGNKYFMGALAVLLLILTLICILLKYKKKDFFEKIQCRRTLIIITFLGVIAVALFIIFGIKSGNELFTFNDKWGTYRGFIWTRSWNLFCDAPLINKIFGYGNESIEVLMNRFYRQEMLDITNRVYDNAHNEILQYLVTTGILGAVSYIGLFVSGMIYMIKRAKLSPVVIACAAACAAYFAQGLVNVNQPITSPFYFVIMAVGIGYIRYRDQHYGPFKEK